MGVNDNDYCGMKGRKYKDNVPIDCNDIDIGCVPETVGPPDCAPERDQLPFKVNKETGAIWWFSCDDRQWHVIERFSPCELSATEIPEQLKNLGVCLGDMIRTIITYDVGNGCVEASMKLSDLIGQILKCLNLRHKITCIGTGGTDFKIEVETESGEPLNLNPLYIHLNNLQVDCDVEGVGHRTGTETNPLTISGHPPICDLDTITDDDLEAADSVKLAGCVDGKAVLIVPEDLCEKPLLNDSTAEADQENIALLVCHTVDGKAEIKRINLQPGFFNDLNLCELPFINIGSDTLSDFQFAVCHTKPNGDKEEAVVNLPPAIFEGGWEYLCVPYTDGTISEPPAEGTGPIRIDVCTGELYVWNCEDSKWIRAWNSYRTELTWDDVKDDIKEPCEDIIVPVYTTRSNPEDCDLFYHLKLSEFISRLHECDDEPLVKIDSGQVGATTCIGVRVTNGTGDEYIYQSRDKTIIANGTGGEWWGNGFSYGTITVTNDFHYPAFVEVRAHLNCTFTTGVPNSELYMFALLRLSDKLNETLTIPVTDEFWRRSSADCYVSVNMKETNKMVAGSYGYGYYKLLLNPGETKVLYVQDWCGVYKGTASATIDGGHVFHYGNFVEVYLFNKGVPMNSMAVTP